MPFTVRLVAAAGTCPFTQRSLPAQEETLTIDAASPQQAYEQAQGRMTMRLNGQQLTTYVNGQEHRDARC